VTVLVDTNVLVDLERGAEIGVPTGETFAVSAMTLAELTVGLLRASTSTARKDRLDAYGTATTAEVLSFDETVARTYGELIAWATDEGIRPSVADGIIAATAATHGLPLVTRDTGMQRLAGFDGLELLVV
jgi:predicted nucleic acid-binding protein